MVLKIVSGFEPIYIRQMTYLQNRGIVNAISIGVTGIWGRYEILLLLVVWRQPASAERELSTLDMSTTPVRVRSILELGAIARMCDSDAEL
jgi:hypothetical protein